MRNKTVNSRDLAKFFAENIEKENIVAAIFNHFRLDCVERCNLNPSQFDALVRNLNEAHDSDLDVITSIIDMVMTGQASACDKENAWVQKITSYVLAHLTEDISMEAIAESLHISYFYMCHIFKNKYGISVNTFRTQKRLEIAIRKLVESNDKIADIAIFSGFGNISYFTEIFTKMVGVSPTAFRAENKDLCLHNFYEFEDMLLASNMPAIRFTDENVIDLEFDGKMISVKEPDDQFGFLHEAAVIAYHGVLYASWYNCRTNELQGYTPICGKRSYDGGETWSDLEIICEDKSEKIMYCPPVYGICDDKLYMLVNQMVAPDHMHALDLYVLNNETEQFDFVWSRPIPFKLNTNVVHLPNGKLMLPGRIAELDGFPNTPAVLISDDGKIDTQWRLVKIAENGDLPDGKALVHPEISVMRVDETLYMFNRNDQRKVPIVYTSKDYGEHWSEAIGHDIPYVSTKIYAGNLNGGENYLIANIDEFDRSKLAVYFTDKSSAKFKKRIILFDKKTTKRKGATACHYPAAYESDGKLYVIATLGYGWLQRGATLFVLDLNKINPQVQE